MVDTNHIKFMWRALEEAEKAAKQGEVPIGAVLVDDKLSILSRAHNQAIFLNDPTAHAEIMAIRKATSLLKNYRLPDTTLYVSLEPCLMCAGAILHARIRKLVFGTFDSKGGAFGSLYDVARDPRLNHRIEVVSGILADECKNLIRKFFEDKR